MALTGGSANLSISRFTNDTAGGTRLTNMNLMGHGQHAVARKKLAKVIDPFAVYEKTKG